VHRVNESASWGRFFQQVSTYAERRVAPVTRLFRSRQGRHGDSFLLANLIETCKDSLCEEPRDKVYGYVGIAHDSQDGSFPIDYSKSFFELYEDVIRVQYRNVKLSIISIVRFGQLVQRLLGGPSNVEGFLKDTTWTAHPLRSLHVPRREVEYIQSQGSLRWKHIRGRTFT
jgi:hypothetical protein